MAYKAGLIQIYRLLTIARGNISKFHDIIDCPLLLKFLTSLVFPYSIMGLIQHLRMPEEDYQSVIETLQIIFIAN